MSSERKWTTVIPTQETIRQRKAKAEKGHP